MAKEQSKQLVMAALKGAQSKKAENIAVMELPPESSAFTDYFLVCSGSNPRQVQAISDEVEESLSKLGAEPNHREGYNLAEWILLDYVDFVVHIFSENARKFYDLERLWKSAKRITEADLKAAPSRRSPSRKSTASESTTKPAKKVASKKTPAKRTTRSASRTKKA
jgi:ribosome-associated protein